MNELDQQGAVGREAGISHPEVAKWAGRLPMVMNRSAVDTIIFLILDRFRPA